MRILVLTPTFLPAWGGAERLLYEIFALLAEKHEVHLLAPHLAPKNPSPITEPYPFTVHRYTEKYRFDQLRGRQWHQGYFPPFEFGSVSATLRLTKQIKPDILNVFYAIPTGLAGVATQRSTGTPFVLSYVGRDVPGPSVPRGWNLYNRWLIRQARQTTFISDYCRTAILGPQATQGTTVYTGAQQYPPALPSDIEILRQKLGLTPETTILFSLQRLREYKGVDVQIRAMKYLKELPCVLLIAGTGPISPQLQELITAEGLENHVRLLGFVPEEQIATYWGLTDIFVFHSYYETFGMALAEAMQAGKAIVSVNSTAIPELISPEVGLLVEPGDAPNMAQAIRTLIQNKALRQQMGQAGVAKAERMFSWPQIAHNYEAVFESSINQ